MGLLYYVPGEKRGMATKPDQLAAAGIAYAFEKTPTATEVTTGPAGREGVVLVADATDVRAGYYPHEQEWRKVPGSDSWVGRELDKPINPVSLARKQQFTGHLVTLADGQAWIVPVARSAWERDGELVGAGCALPRVTTVDDEGNWIVGDVRQEYATLWAVAERVWDQMTSQIAALQGESDEDVTVRIDFAGLNDAALLALATNYRVGKAEVAMLELFDTDCVIQILRALVDMPTVDAFLKKKQAECVG